MSEAKEKTEEALFQEALRRIPQFDWDDPSKSDDERFAEYEKRFDRVLLPPPYPGDPKEGEYERIPGSFEVPLRDHPGWRMGYVPKGLLFKEASVEKREKAK